jgi:PAS domain S-box-containing protein
MKAGTATGLGPASTLAHGAFWAAILAVLGMAYAQYDWTFEAFQSSHDTTRSERILSAAHAVNEGTARAESALRSYGLTREPRYLEEQQRALASLDRAVAELALLALLIVDDSGQLARVHELERLVEQRVAAMDESLQAYRRGSPAVIRRTADAASVLSEAIYATTERIAAQESHRRALHEQHYIVRYESGRRLFIGTIGGSVLLLAVGYVLFLRQARRRAAAEGRLIDLADHSPGALFRYRQRRGGGSHYEFVSRDVAGLLGTDRETALRDPMALFSRVLPEDRAPLAAAIRAAARRLGRFEHEFRVRRPDDAVHWIRSTASLRAEPDGSVLWNGYWADVTEQKRAEAERDRFFTLALDMLCIAGADGHFKRLNPAFTQTLGWSMEELMSRPFTELVHPDDIGPTLRAIAAATASGEAAGHFENRYRHKDGSWRILSWRTVPQPGGLLYATARDVTEQTYIRDELLKARDDADAANRAKSTFLATMSHEIRTPLNGVLGMLELLSLTELDAEQRQTVATVRRSGESLKRIIDDILEFSKIEAGRLDIQAEPASIADVVAGVRNIYASVASSKGLLLEHSVDARISPALVVDALRLQQILNNFVSNALKFTSAGKVSIAAQFFDREHGIERVRFAVTDTGIGIAADRQQALFQPFTQADTDTTRRFGGTGLGLAISRRLADLMGGHIEMESEAGKGTRLTLLLPMRIGDPADLPAALRVPGTAALPVVRRARPRPTREQARADGTLILVVDDHITNRELLARQLGVLGYRADTAEDGAQALRLWQNGDYGLLLADCNMPVVDGYEMSRRIREIEGREGRKRTPIIACTANALRGEAENCLNAGMDGYLAKPAQLVELQRKISTWLPLPDQATGEFPVLPAPPPSADHRVTLDRTALTVISGGDAAMEREILRDFRRINEADAVALKQAVEQGDLSTIRRASHRIKGASRMVGAGGLAAVCDRLERASTTGDWPAIRADLDAFRGAMEQLHQAIAEV